MATNIASSSSDVIMIYFAKGYNSMEQDSSDSLSNGEGAETSMIGDAMDWKPDSPIRTRGGQVAESVDGGANPDHAGDMGDLGGVTDGDHGTKINPENQVNTGTGLTFFDGRVRNDSQSQKRIPVRKFLLLDSDNPRDVSELWLFGDSLRTDPHEICGLEDETWYANQSRLNNPGHRTSPNDCPGDGMGVGIDSGEPMDIDDSFYSGEHSESGELMDIDYPF